MITFPCVFVLLSWVTIKVAHRSLQKGGSLLPETALWEVPDPTKCTTGTRSSEPSLQGRRCSAGSDGTTGERIQPGPGSEDPEGCRADAVPVDGTFYFAEEEIGTEGWGKPAAQVGLKAGRWWPEVTHGSHPRGSKGPGSQSCLPLTVTALAQDCRSQSSPNHHYSKNLLTFPISRKLPERLFQKPV